MKNPKYVRIVGGNTILVSEDNFKTYTEVESIDGYEVLLDRDLITQVNLEYKYGKKRSDYLVKQFQQINKMLANNATNLNDGYGCAFEVFAIATIHNRTYEQVLDDNIVIGSNDGKVDAVFWDDATVYIYQIKLNDTVKREDIYLAQQNYKIIMHTQKKINNETSDLYNFLVKHHLKLVDKQLKVITISTEKNSKYNINSQWLFDEHLKNVLLPQEKNNLKMTIPVPEITNEETGDLRPNYAQKDSTIFIFVRANELLEPLYNQGIISSKSDKMFFDNVRGILGENISMQETIRNNPDKFDLYNNGISIIGNMQLGTGEIKVYNPIVINGQQTIYNLMIAKEKGINISNITLPVFIKGDVDKKEKLNIAKYNNSQKQVKDVDLLSIDYNLREIQSQLLQEAFENNFDENSFYLQLISNGKRASSSIAKGIFDANCVIPLGDFIRSYWIYENKRLLGGWKNSISTLIRKEIINKMYSFNLDTAKRVCKNIRKFHLFLGKHTKDKSKYQVADVVFIYLINEFAENDVKKIIDYINNDIKSRVDPPKLIDLYKSNNIESYIEEAKDHLQIK